MKPTLPLFRMASHNLYRMMRNQWKVVRKRKIQPTNAFKYLLETRDEIEDANDYVTDPRPIFDFSTVVGLVPRPVPKDENHPLFKEKACFTFRDHSVLLEGLTQALVLTNSIQIEPNTLPPQIESLIDTVQIPNQDHLVQRCIKTSCLYDAEQAKLPVRKDPERPAWRFPRDFGISDYRKNRMLCNRLLHLCSLACPEVQRSVFHNVPISVPLLYNDENVQFQVRSDVFISTEKPLSPLVNPADVERLLLPEISISHPIISLEEENFYEMNDVFPLKEGAKFSNVHTILVHYNGTEVKNLYETPVTLDQILSRSLVKTFSAAMAQARYTYGPTVKDIPKPIVVQCVQTDGKTFLFSVLQLNSADVFSERRNVFWSLPPINLYEDCSYRQAIPVLEDYNPQVFKYMLSFYMNDM